MGPSESVLTASLFTHLSEWAHASNDDLLNYLNPNRGRDLSDPSDEQRASSSALSPVDSMAGEDFRPSLTPVPVISADSDDLGLSLSSFRVPKGGLMLAFNPSSRIDPEPGECLKWSWKGGWAVMSDTTPLPPLICAIFIGEQLEIHDCALRVPLENIAQPTGIVEDTSKQKPVKSAIEFYGDPKACCTRVDMAITATAVDGDDQSFSITLS